MNFLNMLGGIFNINSSDFGNFSWLYPIASFLEGLLVPVTIILAVAGGVWVIVLGVQLAKAESTDKAQESKKRLINVAVAIVAVIVFIWVLSFFVSQVPNLFGSTASNPIGSAGGGAGEGGGEGGEGGFFKVFLNMFGL